jgi:hypothetical protein
MKTQKTTAAERRSRSRTPHVAPSRQVELLTNQEILIRAGRHNTVAEKIAHGLAEETVAIRRVLHRLNEHLRTDDSQVLGGQAGDDLSLVLSMLDSQLSNRLNLIHSLQSNLNDSLELTDRLGDRLPTDVLGARSRRPGRRR